MLPVPVPILKRFDAFLKKRVVAPIKRADYKKSLRLFECLQLRVKAFNFEAGILTVHGKGKKDRTVPLPKTIVPELTSQLEMVKYIHDQDKDYVSDPGYPMDSYLQKNDAR